jgi:midasin
MGSYVSDSEGKLKFQEGALVEAVRKGYWLVLDELNLAPSEVLEALNRLLDDNRELFIPETQEVVKYVWEGARERDVFMFSFLCLFCLFFLFL